MAASGLERVIVFFPFYFKPYFKQETTINPIKNKGGAEVDACDFRIPEAHPLSISFNAHIDVRHLQTHN